MYLAYTLLRLRLRFNTTFVGTTELHLYFVVIQLDLDFKGRSFCQIVPKKHFLYLNKVVQAIKATVFGGQV